MRQDPMSVGEPPAADDSARAPGASPSQLGIILLKVLCVLIVLVTFYWEIRLILWAYDQLSRSGAIQYALVVLREFLLH